MSTNVEHANISDKSFGKLKKLFSGEAGAYQPGIFPLGYFSRRHEHRLLYVMPLTMYYDGIPYPLKSKNISAHGLQVFLPRTFFQEDKIVQLSFDKFIKEQRETIGGIDTLTCFENINYRIKEVHHVGEKTYISLIQQNLSKEAMDFLQRFIIDNRLRYKIDASDRVKASKAQFYENLYTINMSHIPMFIHWDELSGLTIDTIIKTEQNSGFFDFLQHETDTSYFLPFCLPQRVEKFTQLARNNESALLFIYWEKGQLHSVFDFEFHSNDDLRHISKTIRRLKGRVFKMSTNLNQKPAAEKMTALLSKIQCIDAVATKKLDKLARESIAQVIFTDITRIFSRQVIFSKKLITKISKPVSLTVLRGTEQICMADGSLMKSFSKQSIHTPCTVYFSLSHRRYDPRYQFEMDVNIHFNHQTYSGTTVDFSRSGLGVLIKQDIDVNHNDIIDITFSSLLLKGGTTQLKNIPHRVMIASKTQAGLFLGVIRNSSQCSTDINRYFSRLINKNKHKLEICVKDKIDNINSIFYEAFVTKNIQTIPVVITRDKNNYHYIREVGLTETPCRLAEKLHVKGYGYDFRFLTSQLRLQEIYCRAIKVSPENSQSFMLFLFKEMNSEGQEEIMSVTDFELDLDNMEKIVHTVFDKKGICLRIKFMSNLMVDKLLRDHTLNKVEKLNKASARLLAQEYKDMLGFAEMLDLTDEYKKMYGYQSPYKKDNYA